METSPGSYLKEIRLRLNLGLREVQHISSKIAARERNRRFYISPARLTQIENDDAIPSQFKIFTLSTIYGLPFHQILSRYGVDADRSHVYRAEFKLSATRPITSILVNPDRMLTVPMRLDPSFKWEQTQLVNRAVALWGEIPAAFLMACNPRRHMYAYIGLDDNTMSPLLRPGALVMVDEERRDVADMRWSNELERPIYLIEFRAGYLCSWCEVSGSMLTAVPHPTSGAHVRSFNLATEVEVIGQVVGVAMRLVPSVPPNRARGVPLPARI